MKRRGALLCAWVFSVGCTPQGPIKPSAPDALDAATDALDAATDALDAATDALDAATDALDVATDALDAADDLEDARPPSDGDDARDAFNPAAWTNIYMKLLNNMSYASNCTGEGCHNPGIQMGLDLSSPVNGYATVQAKLVRGDPGASLIVNKLASGEMPRSRTKMPAADLALIEAWILAGAPDD